MEQSKALGQRSQEKKGTGTWQTKNILAACVAAVKDLEILFPKVGENSFYEEKSGVRNSRNSLLQEYEFTSSLIRNLQKDVQVEEGPSHTCPVPFAAEEHSGMLQEREMVLETLSVPPTAANPSWLVPWTRHPGE
ncbi:hypothetical protein BTVI_14280 [Pitangus sulphuratus]|nr:hypothetical protein BTVI_14280 [Pitangus sulphuratus]